VIGLPSLSEIPSAVKRALKDSWAQLEVIFQTEHDEDGHHTDITAESVTADTATITALAVSTQVVTGTLTVAGATVLNGGLGVTGHASVTGTVFADTVSVTHVVAADAALTGDITTTGDIFATDVDATNGYTEHARATKMGEWIAVAFNALNFFANGVQTWTVGSGDVVVNRYMLVGKTLMWKVGLTGTTVGGTPNTELRISIPGGFTAANYSVAPLAVVTDNGTQMVGFVEATNGQTLISIKLNLGATNWTNATDNTAVFFTIAIEVA
jgi:hypothetical protein